MTQHTFGFFHCLYKTSLIGLGSLSLLGSNLAWGQTGTTDVIIDVPAPVAAPQPVAPTPTPAVVAQPAAPVPAPPKPALSAPKISISAPPPQAVPAPVQPQAAVAPAPRPSQPTIATEGKNSYIDTQTYSAEKPLSQPTVVVESATGCQTVVANGQLQSGHCGNIARKPDKAPVTTTQAVVPQPRVNQTNQARTTQTVAFRPAQPRPGKTTAVSQSKGVQAKANPKANWSRLYSLPKNDSVVNTALLFPVSIPATITSVFGWRVHPITGDRRMHSGTDIGAPLGTPVLAAYPGEVAVADRLGGYGLTVILRHEEGTQESRYAHLAEILVQPGEWVDQGSVIGLVGSTGNSTGPHLHFEWRYLTASGWVAVDAGIHLEAAMVNLIRSMEVAQNPASSNQ